MNEYYINNYTPTVGSGGINTSSTSLPVSSIAPVNSGFRILVGSELMLVTGGGTTLTWTVSRAVESTVAAAHNFGDVINIVLTQAGFTNILNQTNLWGAYVQSYIGSGLSIATLANTTTGNLMIVTCNYENGVTTPTCADTQGTSYSLITTLKPNAARCAVFYGTVGGSGANTITVTSAGANYPSISYTEMLPMWSSVSTYTATAGVTQISVTTSVGNLVFAVCAGEYYTHAAITPYTPLQLLNSIVISGTSDPMTTAFFTNSSQYNKPVICNFNGQGEPHPGVIGVVFQ
jgi:hypothetical protein